MLVAIEFTVPGLPAPQGSKTGFRNKHTGRINMVESSKAVKPWRADVRTAAAEVMTDDHKAMYEAPIFIQIEFYFPRPKGHYGTGRNADVLKESAPPFPIAKNRNDVDKLARAVLDALTGVVFADDSQVVVLEARKRYSPDGRPSAAVYIEGIEL